MTTWEFINIVFIILHQWKNIIIIINGKWQVGCYIRVMVANHATPAKETWNTFPQFNDKYLSKRYMYH